MRLCGKCFGDDDDSEESDGSSLGFTDFEILIKFSTYELQVILNVKI